MAATMTTKRKRWTTMMVSLLLLVNVVQGQRQRYHYNVNNHMYSDESAVNDVEVECNSDNIVITLHASSEFNGLIYPKGLAKNSSCMVEYSDAVGTITYQMPLHSCNTMSNDVKDGVEYFNTVVVQPHRRLVTNQGKGFHIRCKYQTKDKIVSNGPGVNISDLLATPFDVSGDLPDSFMKIFVGEDESSQQLYHQAENVKIGDNLRMVLNIESQSVYGMKVTDCLVRDGLNWGEQVLINEHGCASDRELMGELDYSADKTMATVTFQAHKFPYTSSVYYQCNIRLCLKENGGCDDVPPHCTSDGRNLKRRKRQAKETEITEEGDLKNLNEADPQDLSVSVYSGFHVNDPEDQAANEPPSSSAETTAPDDSAFCISARLFAIIIAIIGIILMAAVILLVVFLVQRRRRRKDVGTTAGSSIYSGPYSNHGYSSS